MVLLFIEGPDRAGKDTFAKMLSAVTGIPKVEYTFPGEVQFSKIDDEVADMLVLTEFDILRSIRWDETSLIVVRHPLVSHLVHRSRTKIAKIPSIPESKIFLLAPKGREQEVDTYARIMLRNDLNFVEIRVDVPLEGMFALAAKVAKEWGLC